MARLWIVAVICDKAKAIAHMTRCIPKALLVVLQTLTKAQVTEKEKTGEGGETVEVRHGCFQVSAALSADKLIDEKNRLTFLSKKQVTRFA